MATTTKYSQIQNELN